MDEIKKIYTAPALHIGGGCKVFKTRQQAEAWRLNHCGAVYILRADMFRKFWSTGKACLLINAAEWAHNQTTAAGGCLGIL